MDGWNKQSGGSMQIMFFVTFSEASRRSVN